MFSERREERQSEKIRREDKEGEEMKIEIEKKKRKNETAYVIPRER